MQTELETKPGHGEDQADAAMTAKPDGAAGSASAEPSGAEGAEPSLRAQFDDLRRKQDDILKGMYAAQREAAELRAERDLYQRQAQALVSTTPAQPSDEDAAWQRFQQSYSPDDLRSAMELRDRRMRRELQAEMMTQQRLAATLPKAREMLAVNDDATLAQRLRVVHDTLTPEDLAFIDLRRQGKLTDWIAEEQKARERRAKEAALSGPIGQPGGRIVPGAASNGRKTFEVPFEEWALLTKEAKARLRADPNADYVIVGGPRYFDPNKDD